MSVTLLSNNKRTSTIRLQDVNGNSSEKKRIATGWMHFIWSRSRSQQTTQQKKRRNAMLIVRVWQVSKRRTQAQRIRASQDIQMTNADDHVLAYLWSQSKGAAHNAGKKRWTNSTSGKSLNALPTFPAKQLSSERALQLPTAASPVSYDEVVALRTLMPPTIH